MNYTNVSKDFLYTIEQEKQMMLHQAKIDAARTQDEILKKYVRGIVDKTMSPGLSIRRIIDEKYIDEKGTFLCENGTIENMPYFDMCESDMDFLKYRDAFKMLAKSNNIKCENKQYKVWIEATHSYSISRKMLFKIAFILGMTREETEKWLVEKLMVQGINFRDIEEVVYDYCLRNALTYNEAELLITECKGIISNRKNEHNSHVENTKFLSETVVKVLCKEDLFEYIKQYANEFDKVSRSRLETFKKLCEEAKDLIMQISKGETFCFDNTRLDAKFDKSNRMLGNMITFGIPIVDDTEYSVRLRDINLSKDITKNELGAQRIEGIIKGKIGVERKDILWIKFFIRAMQIQYAEKLGIEELYFTEGIENAEDFKSYMDDYLPTLGYGGLYYANAFDNIIFFSLLDERPYETFLNMLDETEK